MTFPRFWRKRRPSASAEDRPGDTRKALDPKPSEPFRYPLPSTSRIALLEGGFETKANIRQFASADSPWLREYAPESLVAPLELALSLADQKRRGLFDLPSLNTALVIVTQIDDVPLAEHHRDLLWRAFGLPVFEQVRGWDGKIVARECEVHDGLHLEPSTIPHLDGEELLLTQLGAPGGPIIRARTGLAADIVNDYCYCGQDTPRLRNLSPIKSVRIDSGA